MRFLHCHDSFCRIPMGTQTERQAVEHMRNRRNGNADRKEGVFDIPHGVLRGITACSNPFWVDGIDSNSTHLQKMVKEQ